MIKAVSFGGSARYTVTIVLYQNRFYEYEVSFPSGDYSFIAQTIGARLGQPSGRENSMVENRMGAKFEQSIQLGNGVSTKTQVKRLHDTVVEGALIVTYLPIEKTIEETPGKAPF